ncbi:MAG: PBP1A family penicillin-binding protein [Proteobacteria bacterium]|nr:PBP1A family penicillin-binding protein [Pseudomonadota bacterium]
MAPPATTLPRARTRPGGQPSGVPRPARPIGPPTVPGPSRPPEGAWQRRALLWLLRWSFIAGVWGALAAIALLLWFARDLPRPEDALDPARRPSLVLQDRNGRIIASYGDLVGEPLHLKDLPPALSAAVVAVEDRRFWHHPGIDPIGLLRAGYVNLTSGRVVQGGSTLTQQVAKTLFLTNARTMRRKVQEVLLTLWLERHFSKKEILEIYLNRVYLGAGAWGVDAGARTFFGVSARKVTLPQAAVLAGLPRAPSRFNPRSSPSAATARAKEVLAAMVDTGAITAEQAQAAAAQIAFPPTPVAPGWFADWVAEASQTLIAPDRDAVLRTTLDARYQAIAEKRLDALLSGAGAAASVTQGAVVIVDAANGAVRAMVGGRDYRESPFNRAVLARRQPGSAFKPVVWLAALHKGMTPSDTVLDSPVRIGTWSPANFERRYLGEITLQEALAQSINTVAVRLLMKAGGPKAVAATAARLGITDRLPNDASLALGTGEVGLLEMTVAYAPFFNGGYRVIAHGLDQTPHEATHVIDADEAAMMHRMLNAVVTRGTGRAAGIPGRDISGKTGTTQDSRDAWFIGRVATGTGSGLLIGIWLGNDDNSPMRNVHGGNLPARLFRDIAVALQ